MLGWCIFVGIFLGLAGGAIYMRQHPPEMSELGQRRFRRAMLQAAISSLLTLVVLVGFLAVRPPRFSAIYEFLGLVTEVDILLTGATIFSCLRGLWSLFPFAKGDVSDFSAESAIVAVLLTIQEFLLLLVMCGIMFAP